MSYATLADFLEELDRLGQLRSGDATADMPEAARLHRNLGGDDVPCVTGLLATEERICRALGVASPEEVAERLGRLLAAQSVRAAACESVAQVVDGALAKFAPRPARVGSCQKVVRLGDDVDLQQLPVPCDGPDMARRTITTGQIGSRDPASGRAWLGHAELSIHSRRELVLHVAPYEPLAELLAAYRKAGEPTPLAVALGGNPVCLPAAMGPVPMPIDGLALAGFLAGGSIDVVRCRTLDLWVPAEADFVLEGTIDPAAAEIETGPVATPLGHAAPSRPGPVLRVGSLTHRANPVLPAVVHGDSSREWVAIQRAMQRILLPLLRMAVGELTDCNLPECGHARELAWVSIRGSDPAAAARVARSFWELPATRFCKIMVIVDEDVDVHDPQSVWTAVAANVNPSRDVIFHDGPPDPWDPAVGQTCRRMALDATRQDWQ